MKRFFAVLLILSGLLSLSACAPETKATENAAASSEAEYYIQYEELPAAFSVTTMQTGFAGGLYIVGEDSMGNTVHGILKDGSFTRFSDEVADKEILAACACEDNIAAVIAERAAYADETQKTAALRLNQFDEKGNMLSSFELSDPMLSYEAGYFSLCFLDGCFYMMSSGRLVRLSADGKAADCIDFSAEQNIPGVFVSQCPVGEKLAVCIYGYGAVSEHFNIGRGGQVYLLDGEQFKLEPLYSFPDSWPCGLGAKSENSLLYFDDQQLCELNVNTKQAELIAVWADLGLLLVPYSNIITLNDSSFVLSGEDSKLCTLLNGVYNDSRIELTLLCNQESLCLRTLVQEFNLTDREYCIRIEQTDSEELADVQTMAGQTPDLYFFFGGIPLSETKQRKVFADLYPFFDADPSYGRDTIEPSLRQALENEGGLYILPFDYIIWTFLTRADIDGIEDMDLKEFAEACRLQYPDYNIIRSDYSLSDLWYWISNLCVGSFIDKAAGKCTFNDAAYAALLEATKALSAEAVLSANEHNLFEVQQVGTVLRMYGFDMAYGEHFSLLGCPTGSAANGSAFDLQQCYAISESSENKEGAWKFLRSVMDARLINNSNIAADICLPASVLQKDAIIFQARGKGYRAYDMDIKISEHAAEELTDIISATNSIMGAQAAIVSIMQEEANKYFSGDCTLQSAVDATQSRASIYMAEQYG